jgi:hypothetical protein
VVGHTPTGGAIWPRYDAKVLMIDSGISSAYGGHIAYLEITDEGLFAGYPQGKLAIPAHSEGLVPYLEKVIEGNPDSAPLKKTLKLLNQPAATATGDDSASADNMAAAVEGGTATPLAEEETIAEQPPICGISP